MKGIDTNDIKLYRPMNHIDNDHKTENADKNDDESINESIAKATCTLLTLHAKFASSIWPPG